MVGGLCCCAKFCWNQQNSFEDMRVSISSEFGLKMHIHAPFWNVFGLKWENGSTRDDIADVITHTKFRDNWFRGFRVLITQILPFSTGLAGRPYNGANITMLHYDELHLLQSPMITRAT